MFFIIPILLGICAAAVLALFICLLVFYLKKLNAQKVVFYVNDKKFKTCYYNMIETIKFPKLNEDVVWYFDPQQTKKFVAEEIVDPVFNLYTTVKEEPKPEKVKPVKEPKPEKVEPAVAQKVETVAEGKKLEEEQKQEPVKEEPKQPVIEVKQEPKVESKPAPAAAVAKEEPVVKESVNTKADVTPAKVEEVEAKQTPAAPPKPPVAPKTAPAKPVAPKPPVPPKAPPKPPVPPKKPTPPPKPPVQK